MTIHTGYELLYMYAESTYEGDITATRQLKYGEYKFCKMQDDQKSYDCSNALPPD